MDNALSVTPAPMPEQQPGPGGSASAAQGSGPGAPGAQGGAPQQAAPQLSHAQAVAVLRHLTASARELESLMNDPALGKSTIRSKIIDGATKLVSHGMMSAAQAVGMLGTVPDEPLLQRKWVRDHFASNMLAMNAVLDHHAAGNPGTQDHQVEMAKSTSSPDDHLAHVGEAMSLYKGGTANG